MVQKRLLNKLVRYRKALEAAKIPVHGMWLFGSRARGDHHEESDIDVCVVSSLLGKDVFTEGIRLDRIASRIDPLFEVIPCSIKDWKHNRVSPLLHEIRKTGIRVA